MEPLAEVDESLPTPSHHFLQEQSQTAQEASVAYIGSFVSPSPPVSFSTQAQSSLPASGRPHRTPRLTFVSYEMELRRAPALTTCHFCESQVITEVTYNVGRYVWLMCLLIALFGLVLGCCLIPCFLNRFKDAYHTCPRCQLILHIHRKTCRE